MKKTFLLVLSYMVTLSAYAFSNVDFKAKADSAMYFYGSGEYYKCIGAAKSISNGFPYRGSEKRCYYQTLAYDALSIHALEPSYGENIRDSYFPKFEWAAQACDFFDSILKDDLKFIKSSQSIIEYYNALELACKSYGCIADMTDGITKRYDKTAQVRIERAYKFTFKDRHKWDDNAFARLYILFIRLKGKFVQLKGSYFGNNIN